MKLLSLLLLPAVLAATTAQPVQAKAPVNKTTANVSFDSPYTAFLSANCFFGDAAGFAVLAGTTITNTSSNVDQTLVMGNIGVYPGTAITGFVEAPAAATVSGKTYCATGINDPAPTMKAQIAAQHSYNELAALAPTNTFPAGDVDLGGLTLQPGVYKFGSSAQISVSGTARTQDSGISNGVLILDDTNDPNAVFVFQMGSTLTANVGTTIKMKSGGHDPNIYWIAGSSATVGVGATFEGNIIATTAITINTDASTDGRLFALGAAVTMQYNKVSPKYDSDGDGITDCMDGYPNNPKQAFNNPSTVSTIAFEDQWPLKGDFDMNDVVIKTSYNLITNAKNNVVHVTATYTLMATGGILKNAFGVEFPVPAASISNVKGSSAEIHQEITGQDKAVILIYSDMRKEMPTWNTRQIDTWTSPKTYTVDFDVADGVSLSAFGQDGYNPFIFNTVNNSRREVHLSTKKATTLADKSVFGTGDDNGVGNYKTKGGLPFAIIVPTANYSYPIETVDISFAFLHFPDFASPNGGNYPDWYSNTAPGYRNNSNIYVAPAQ